MCVCFELQFFSKVDTLKVEFVKMEGGGEKQLYFLSLR